MNAKSPVPSRSDRRGMTLAEVAVSAVLLLGVMVVTFQAMVASSAGQQALDRRQAAVQEAATAMERLASRPWEDLTPGAVQDVRLSDEVAHRLAEATIRVEIDQSPENNGPKRIAVEVGWVEYTDGPPLRVRLVSFRYPPPSPPGESP